MRTTVEFDADTAKAIEKLRHEEGLGVSEAVNALIRRGLLREAVRPPFRQRTAPLGLRIDMSSAADAPEVLQGPSGR